MATQPDVSVIITSYKIPTYIKRAVDSALSQEAVTVEVILVDDCSPDNTWEVIETISDPRVKAVRMERNGGPSKSRNRAISLATGTWIAVLDGDDAFLPGRLARMVTIAREKQADLVVDNQQIVHELDGKRVPMFEQSYLRTIQSYVRTMPIVTLEALIASNTDFIGSTYGLGYLKPIFRRDFLDKHALAYSENIRIGEDYVFLFEVLASGARCVFDSEIGYSYTVRASSISHRLTPVDVAIIQAEDDRLVRTYKLSAAALNHQARRAQNLIDAHAYNRIVEAIKSRRFGDFIMLAFSHSQALVYLRVPLANRYQRIMDTLFPAKHTH
jgi:succinoglycan biosynthesis protein ExoO